MTRDRILLVGAGGHAMACIDVIEQDGRFDIAGLVGNAAEVGSQVLGYAVTGTDDDLPQLLAAVPNALIAVGQIKSPELRMHLFERVRALGGRPATLTSPLAHVSRHATIGSGTIVMHGAVVNAGAIVGRNCIINSLALIEHGVCVGDHCHIATHAAVNSDVRVGSGTFIGSGTSVRQGVAIGERCVVGMGQRVLADCPDGTWLPRPGVKA